MEPTQQKLVAAESARAALVAQLEQERAACQTWQRRNSELLDKTATSVGQEAYKELDRAKLTKGCIELALSLKAQDQDRAAKEVDDSQPSLLED
jgi:rubrerythrin